MNVVCSDLSKEDVDAALPRVRPYGWRERTFGPGRHFWRQDGLSVIVTGGLHSDGRKWLHFSVARPDRLPTWDDLKETKRLFLGPERKAIQVIPKDSQYVNIHPYCLHLFACLSDDGLPDFTGGEKTL